MEQPVAASTSASRRVAPNVVFGAAFFATAAAWLVWWVAFQPGILSTDSLEIWEQAHAGLIYNWHPYLYAEIIKVLTHIWDSPAIVGLAQIAMGATVVGWIARIAAERGVRWWLIAPAVAIYALYPQFGFYSVILWKDVPFSILLLAEAVLVYLASSTHRDKLWPYVALGLIAGVSTSIRVNGILNLVLPLVLLALVRAPWRRLAAGLATSVCTYIFFSIVLFNLLNVQPAILQTDQLRLKVVGAVYARNGELTPEERRFFESMWPASVWRSAYHPETANFLFFEHFRQLPQVQGLNAQNIDESRFMQRWEHYSTEVALNNPEIILEDKIDQAGFMLVATDFPWIYVTTNELTAQGLRDIDYPASPNILPAYWFPGLRAAAEVVLVDTSAGTSMKLLWTPVPALVLFGLMLLVAVVRRLKSTLLGIAFFACNAAFVILVAPAHDYRYLFFLALAAPGWFLLLAAEESLRSCAKAVEAPGSSTSDAALQA